MCSVFANSSQLDRETERRLLSASSTLYVGNLSFYTTEAQIYERELGIAFLTDNSVRDLREA